MNKTDVEEREALISLIVEDWENGIEAGTIDLGKELRAGIRGLDSMTLGEIQTYARESGLTYDD